MVTPGLLPLPIFQDDGRYAIRLLFRVDDAAEETKVNDLLRLLFLAPTGTTYDFAIPDPRTRELTLRSIDAGELYAFGNRVLEAIRLVGDLVDEDDVRTTVVAPRPMMRVESKWTFEEPEQEPVILDDVDSIVR